MKKGLVKSLIVLVTLICGLVFVCVACKKNQSDEADTGVSGTILVSSDGTVYLEDASGNRTQIAAGDVIGNGDILVTEQGGKAVVSLAQGGTVYLEENTRLEFVLEGNTLDLFVVEGKILVDAQKKSEGIEKL
ncbi:MAG: FecR domain-containing protein, partial [Lachnospiraceae bacterium]|nr:FecR domain-containing protein [Lachnospiraceae bacterium]